MFFFLLFFLFFCSFKCQSKLPQPYLGFIYLVQVQIALELFLMQSSTICKAVSLCSLACRMTSFEIDIRLFNPCTLPPL